MSRQPPFSASYPSGVASARHLTTQGVIVLVIAAAAPLAAMIGNTPLAFTTGAGLSLPVAFVFIGATLLCFAAGYSALSREIVAKGAFYTQVGQGLGRTAGGVAAYAALVAYATYSTGMAAAFGYFAALLTKEIGFEVHWMACAAFGMTVVAILGYRSLDVSARVLKYFMAAEFGVLLVFDALVLRQKGFAAFPSEVWAPAALFNPSIGAIIPFALICFLGFEASGLYGEETRDPRTSIPRATFTALTVIAVFYMLQVWLIIGAAGAGDVQALAKTESGNMLFALAETYGGEVLVAVMGIFLVASILASYLAIHNAASRYFFALAADHLLPNALAGVHPNHHAPHIGSMTMSALEVLVVVGLGLMGVSPYLGIASAAIGFGTIGVIAMQIACALAVVGFFMRAGRGGLWQTRILPLLGAAGLTVCLIMIVASYSMLTGSENPVVNSLPYAYVPVILGGLVYTIWLKRHRPSQFAAIATSEYRHQPDRSALRPNAYAGRYCIIGAGPSGLIMARAFLAEGIPFDCFERHSDVGGLWDPENQGTPIYDTAHFISSKWTSYFYGYPMPDAYPDYPSARQILAYIRSFADAYGLRPHITLNTAVTRAEPQDDGWCVTLSTGETRHYKGVIACPGIAWHPLLPQIKGAEGFAGEIRHAITYRTPSEFVGKSVLVLGGGNSGVDIACDAAKTARRAFLSVRRGYRFVPKHIFGIPTDVLMSGKALPPKGASLSSDVGRMLDLLNGDLTRLGLPAPDHAALSSHPTMNSQILHHLSHGDVIAKPDVVGFDGTMALFRDGTCEEVDLVILATGYTYDLPFFDRGLFDWKAGRPQLYLNVIHRSLKGLYVLGFADFADAAYRRFDEMAQLIVADIHANETGISRDWFGAQKAGHFPDLRGGQTYVDSPRHTNYVDTDTYRKQMTEIRRRLGWPDLHDETYAALRLSEGAMT